MICRCSKCGELRTVVPLKAGATCSHCLFVQSFEPSGYEPPPAVLENIRCLRVVENLEVFGLMLINDCPSNVEAMITASFASWNMCKMSARPIWSIEKIKTE